MREHQGGVSGERAQHLCRGPVMEIVETAAQRLAVQPDAALSRRRAGGVQQGGLTAEDRLDRHRVEALQDIAEGGVGGGAAPLQPERDVQPVAMHVNERHDAAAGIAAGHDGQDREQQDIGQLVELPLPASGIGNFAQQAQDRRKRNHGNLRHGCRPRSQTSADSRIRLSISRFTSLGSRLARIIHQSWRTWCKPLIGHRIRLRDQNPADFGAHARQG